MNVCKIISAGAAGTTGMTLFSYVLSEKTTLNFKEPRLLGNMIFKLIPLAGKSQAFKVGWVLHYMVGIFFAAMYQNFFKKRLIIYPVMRGSITGGVTGIFAVLVWKTALKIHPFPPIIHYKNFYRQLVVAHMIFGVITISILSFTNMKKVITSQPNQAII